MYIKLAVTSTLKRHRERLRHERVENDIGAILLQCLLLYSFASNLYLYI